MQRILPKIIILYVMISTMMVGMPVFSQVIPKGQIIDTVKCKTTPKQSYALYLPANYDKQKSWPVILIFDPGAKGRSGINSFAEAGRKYGFIMACSNNSHNGPMKDSFDAAAAMLGDVKERFTIDDRRIYSAGFSGGSRFALSLAVTEKISGVIGCGAGLPNDQNFLPSATADFLYYGLAGTRDMNYLEMHELHGFFDNRTRVISYFRTFAGGHQWPGPGQITGAVEWLRLQEMNRKIIPPDAAFITFMENKTDSLINSQLSTGHQADAIMYMRFAVRDFKGTAFASRMTKLLSDSEKSAEYKTAMRKWNRMVETEQQSKENCMNYLGEIISSQSFPDSAAVWWKKKVSELTALRDKGSSENSEMASRVLNFISILCSEQGSSFYRKGTYAQAAILFKICTLSDSENPANYFNLARALAGADRSGEAVEALSAAVDHGLTSRKIVESDPIFDKIRTKPRFKALMQKMK